MTLELKVTYLFHADDNNSLKKMTDHLAFSFRTGLTWLASEQRRAGWAVPGPRSPVGPRAFGSLTWPMSSRAGARAASWPGEHSK